MLYKNNHVAKKWNVPHTVDINKNLFNKNVVEYTSEGGVFLWFKKEKSILNILMNLKKIEMNLNILTKCVKSIMII